jgi:C-terminal binding protein
MMDFLNDVSLEQEILKDTAKVIPYNLQRKSDPIPDSIETAQAVLAWHLVDWNESILKKLKNTKVLVRVGIGVDNVDLKAAAKLGIYVANVPDYGVEEVADSALNHILNLMRVTFYAAYRLNDNKCVPEKAGHATRLRGSVLGLVGFGKIGKAVAVRAKPFGLDVVFYDPYLEDGIEKSLGVRRAFSLKALIEQSDILSLHCYLDETNKDMINKESLSWIKPGGCYFINTARGGLVDEPALIESIKSGRIRGAGLDVQRQEPYPPDGPLLDPTLNNVIVTPHCAFSSRESLIEMRQKAALEVKRVLEGGKPRNCVNISFFTEK